MKPADFTFTLYREIVVAARKFSGCTSAADSLEAAEGEAIRIALITLDDEPLKKIRWALEINRRARKFKIPGKSDNELFEMAVNEWDLIEAAKSEQIVADCHRRRRRLIATGNQHGITAVAPTYEEEMEAIRDLDATYAGLGVLR